MGQAQHVAQVVAGVGQQGQRIDAQAVDDLGGDEPRVQQDADGEGGAEVLRGVGMAWPP